MQTDRPAWPSAGGRPAQAPINAEPPGLPVSLGNRIAQPDDFRLAAGSNQLPDVKRSMAIVRPVTGRGEGLAGWPSPRMVPVWSVFQPRFVLPVKGNVTTTSILVTDGTCTLGQPVTQRLRDAGASVTVLSRRGD